MTAKDTIATNVHAAWCREPNHEDCDGVDEVDERVADAVIAAVRGLPVEDQAELIGGEVEAVLGFPGGPEDVLRAVGAWRVRPWRKAS
jgi:hypothetical protein